MLQVVVTAQVMHSYIALLQLSLPCLSATKCSKHCILYGKFWIIVTLFTKFIRAYGSMEAFLAIFFSVTEIEDFKELFTRRNY